MQKNLLPWLLNQFCKALDGVWLPLIPLLLIRAFFLGLYHQKAPNLTQLISDLSTSELVKVSDYRIVTLVSQLLQFYSREKNMFQFSMGLYFYSCGCSKRVITVLNWAGISVSYNTILNGLKQSADEKLE